jgi:hypothetical protein
VNQNVDRLRKLYQRRKALTRELVELTAMIRTLEKGSVWTAVWRVHHKDGGCSGARNRKRTSDWSLVDCLVCHRRRRTIEKKKGQQTFPRPDRDWKGSL